MSLALEHVVAPDTALPARPGLGEPSRRLNISVVFTTVESTLAALKAAGALAASLGARITLLVPQVVPHPLPLESPPVLLDWNERRFRVIASQSPVETVVRLFLCRDSVETIKDALHPKSVVVIGGGSWWPFSREKRLAATLRRAGHEVVLATKE